MKDWFYILGILLVITHILGGVMLMIFIDDICRIGTYHRDRERFERIIKQGGVR